MHVASLTVYAAHVIMHLHVMSDTSPQATLHISVVMSVNTLEQDQQTSLLALLHWCRATDTDDLRNNV